MRFKRDETKRLSIAQRKGWECLVELNTFVTGRCVEGGLMGEERIVTGATGGLYMNSEEMESDVFGRH